MGTIVDFLQHVFDAHLHLPTSWCETLAVLQFEAYNLDRLHGTNNTNYIDDYQQMGFYEFSFSRWQVPMRLHPEVVGRVYGGFDGVPLFTTGGCWEAGRWATRRPQIERCNPPTRLQWPSLGDMLLPRAVPSPMSTPAVTQVAEAARLVPTHDVPASQPLLTAQQERATMFPPCPLPQAMPTPLTRAALQLSPAPPPAASQPW